MKRKTEPCPKCRARGQDSRGDNLVVFPDGGKHCFACHYHVPGSVRKHMENVLEQVKENEKALLPGDFQREVPISALKWLSQFGIPYTYWKPKIGFSPKEKRLVFTVGRPTQFSLGRYVGQEEGMRKWYVWGDPNNHCEIVTPDSISDLHKVVLVEDLISAHKIAFTGNAIAIPLFGTAIQKAHKYYLMSCDRDVVLWLDYDQAGSIMKKAAGLSMLLGRPVDTVVTHKDPKYLNALQIREALQ